MASVTEGGEYTWTYTRTPQAGEVLRVYPRNDLSSTFAIFEGHA
jgi:hypothetical protein